MADALHVHLLQQGQNALYINPGGGQQGFGNGFAPQEIVGLHQLGIVLHIKDLTHQAEAVGVHTGGGQGNHHISGSHPGIVDDFLFVHNAHGESGQVIVILGHHAGVLGGLAANQGGAGLNAALCHTGHNLGNLFGDVLAAGNVVQEEQGPGTAADNVVDAHGNTVDANGVVLVQQLGDSQLGAYAVGAGDQHRLLHACNGQTKAAAEAAHVIQAALVLGAGNVLFHQLYGPVTGGDVHTGGSVAGRLGVVVFHIVTLLL